MPHRKRRRLLTVALTVLSVTVTLTLLGLGCAVTCRPAWYQPEAIDFARLDADRRAAHQLESAISAALNRDEAVTIEVGQDQLNRWIAARDELLLDPIRIDGLRDPLVTLEPTQRVRLAGIVERAGFGTVVSIDLRLDATPETLTVELAAARLGLLGLPRAPVADRLEPLLAAADLPGARWDGNRLVVPNDWLWQNGARRFRVAEIAVGKGTIRLTLAPR